MTAIWKWATCYLVIGILWASFCSSKAVDFGYMETPRIAALTVLVNAFAWPVSIPVAIYAIQLERSATGNFEGPQ
jgi:hypothetical protein